MQSMGHPICLASRSSLVWGGLASGVYLCVGVLLELDRRRDTGAIV
jgi:hypothetical protein